MDIYLSAKQASRRRAEIQEELAKLLRSPELVGRPGALQWRFLSAVVGRMVGDALDPELDALAPRRTAQLKYEAEDRLRRYYRNPGRPVRFVFGLRHAELLARSGIPSAREWPALAGYVAVIRDVGEDLEALPRERELARYLERVVAEAIDAEFRAYAALPELDTAALEQWFVTDGPAYATVVHVLVRHQERGWVLSNPYNPSTKRLLEVSVSDISATGATARTHEYFYLRWWDEGRGRYAYAYRELNRQRYILERCGDGRWRVLDNLRPAPRSTPPNRRIRRPKRS